MEFPIIVEIKIDAWHVWAGFQTASAAERYISEFGPRYKLPMRIRKGETT